MERFGQVPAWAPRLLTDRQLRLFAVLCARARRTTRLTRVRQAVLASDSGRSDRWVRTVLRELEELGVVTTVRLRSCLEYRIPMELPLRLAAPPPPPGPLQLTLFGEPEPVRSDPHVPISGEAVPVRSDPPVPVRSEACAPALEEQIPEQSSQQRGAPTLEERIASLGIPEGRLAGWRERFPSLDGHEGRPSLEGAIRAALAHSRRRKFDDVGEYLEVWLREDHERHRIAWAYEQNTAATDPTLTPSARARVAARERALRLNSSAALTGSPPALPAQEEASGDAPRPDPGESWGEAFRRLRSERRAG